MPPTCITSGASPAATTVVNLACTSASPRVVPSPITTFSPGCLARKPSYTSFHIGSPEMGKDALIHVSTFPERLERAGSAVRAGAPPHAASAGVTAAAPTADRIDRRERLR